jgi:hypothetical protein
VSDLWSSFKQTTIMKDTFYLTTKKFVFSC